LATLSSGGTSYNSLPSTAMVLSPEPRDELKVQAG
jgi:hypothetical protein